ncbi:cytochrome P450 4c3-like [Uranotaenia lowii]|uniref:cytochrome P450 4c3-like n=1 Tax=Uranotaenia lowii TaxID=190385 RepID=UPI00247A1513|nr:cytochrome P450 4c3-like [Uranotaenia lowii]
MERLLVLITVLYQPVHLAKEYPESILVLLILALIFLLGITEVLIPKTLLPRPSGAARPKSARYYVNQLPGPQFLPFLGNALQMVMNREDELSKITGVRKLYGRRQGMCRLWNGSVPYVLISKAQVIEKIFTGSSGQINIIKGRDYDFLRPWLGNGLFTRPAAGWYHRRKALNPAFNYGMLLEYLEVFNKQAETLVKQLEKEVDRLEGFDCTRYATFCSLDIIFETAMGCSIHAQKNIETDYVKAHQEIIKIVTNRINNVWLQPEWIFRWTNLYQRHQKCLKVLEKFSDKVIHQKRIQLGNQKQSTNIDCENNDIGTKKQRAFLDLLLEITQNGVGLTDKEIREEINTFILGGHETTATAISLLLFLLGTEDQIQQRLFNEIDAVMGHDRDRPPTMIELNEMKYLDCCIREAQRLFPIVPLIARRLVEDVQVDKYTLPAGTNAVIVIYQLHRDPEVFPNPEKFDPDRFLPENVIGRHPFAYMPFSGGNRNCIGQKFALLEEKAVMVAVLRKYRIHSLVRREDLTLYGELVLKSKNGLPIRISRRE